DSKNGETHSKIMKTAKIFDKYKVDYNTLTVITAQTAKHIEKIYNYYKNCGFLYLQFIPCLDPLNEERFKEVYSLAPELYEKFLITLFKLWYNDFMTGNYISIRFFDNIVRIAAGYPGEQCGMTGTCEGQFVIESDGSVFPCDFYCVDNWKIGSIFAATFDELKNSPNMRKFRETSRYSDFSQPEAEKCGTCKVFYLCMGGCRRDRDNKKDGSAGRNIYCEALYNFYSFAEPYLEKIMKKIRN
ncbi:MAG: SPASM domain-containing protein, partial [Oscillospiraceae bacterium]|nr:SPASM domain-containing protein [Oscillospiraceae bacterium]